MNLPLTSLSFLLNDPVFNLNRGLLGVSEEEGEEEGVPCLCCAMD